jgi:hypothetical protein
MGRAKVIQTQRSLKRCSYFEVGFLTHLAVTVGENC